MGKERSSGNKTDELRVLIKTHGCSVMCFMETWLTHTSWTTMQQYWASERLLLVLFTFNQLKQR